MKSKSQKAWKRMEPALGLKLDAELSKGKSGAGRRHLKSVCYFPKVKVVRKPGRNFKRASWSERKPGPGSNLPTRIYVGARLWVMDILLKNNNPSGRDFNWEYGWSLSAPQSCAGLPSDLKQKPFCCFSLQNSLGWKGVPYCQHGKRICNGKVLMKPYSI